MQSMAMREWICRQLWAIRYGTHGSSNTLDDKEATQGTLCCWKAKGEDNLLSAYLRSVPFHLFLTFTKKKQQGPEAEIN